MIRNDICLAVVPGVEIGFFLAGRTNRTHQPNGGIVACLPGVNIGVVANAYLDHFRMGHGHVFAIARRTPRSGSGITKIGAIFAAFLHLLR